MRCRVAQIVLLVGLGVLAIAPAASSQDDHPGWPKEVSSYTDPTVADVNGDGTLEILSATEEGVMVWDHEGNALEGWPYEPISWISHHTPRVGNLDSDPEAEIVVQADRGFVLLDCNANIDEHSPIDTWENNYVGGMFSYWCLADVDGDGDHEIIAIDNGRLKVYAVNGDGSYVDGWPVTVLQDYADGPYMTLAAADLDFDGTSEVIVAAYGYKDGLPFLTVPMTVLNGDGTNRDGWPYEVGVDVGTVYPAVADLNGDYSAEILVTGIFWSDHILKARGAPYIAINGDNGVPRPPIAADLDGDGRLEAIFGKEQLKVYDTNPATGGELLHVVGGLNTELLQFDGLSCADVDGDGDMELMVWSHYLKVDGVWTQKHLLHLFDHEMNELEGWPKEMHTSGSLGSLGGSTLADLDNDGDMEALYHYSGRMFVYDFEKTGPLRCRSEWPTLGHDATYAYNYHALDPPRQVFLRGDSNQDMELDFTDATHLLSWLFTGFETDCPAAMDVDANGTVELTDALGLLKHLFLGGEPPARPYPNCGKKPLGERLKCMEFECPDADRGTRGLRPATTDGDAGAGDDPDR